MSRVYFSKVESPETGKRIQALKKILEKAAPELEYQKKEIVPVKITIGDSTCIYNLQPELVKLVITHIKSKGAKPFLFDTNVIYKGERQNAVDHLTLAQNKGVSHTKVGAPFIVADGLLGQDGKEFNLHAANIKKVKVPSFVGMLDSILVLSHATGHILSGYAGAIKNVAMGISCRPTKQMQHSSFKPSVIDKKCTSCGCCIAICPVKAISSPNTKAYIEEAICIGCSECLCACKFDAISVNWKEDASVFTKRMTEVANFVLGKFKNKFFINFAFDITKECDCISTKNEKMIASDIGILASSDIVALDKATADLANQKKILPSLKETKSLYEKMFTYASQLGMGNMEYDLINV